MTQQTTEPVGTPSSPSSRGPGRLRKWMFRLTAMILVPALLLGITEGALRLFGYGYPTNFFRKIPGQEAYTGNPRFGWRFFPRTHSLAPPPFHLPAAKPAGTYRIFVLGGSAAMGWPGSAYSFSRILDVMLRERFPHVRFEVINAGMVAVNSHVVLPIAHDCADHDADLFIVYMGNNEVIGPFGKGSIFGGYSPNLSAIRASLWGRTTKVGQLIQNVAASLEGGGDPKSQILEKVREHRLAPDDPLLDEVVDHFRTNLNDILAATANAGAKTIVCTVATNLKDCPPFGSLHRPDLDETQETRWQKTYEAGITLDEAGEYDRAVQQYLAAAEIDDQFAELHFRIGSCDLAMKRPAQARRRFLLARDLDAARFRADNRLNTVIREVASARSREGVIFVDAERSLAECPRTRDGILGEELFYDHVHMNFEGNYELARAVFDAVVRQLPEAIRSRAGGAAEPLSRDRCAELLALTQRNRLRMATEVWHTAAYPPFTFQLDHAQRHERDFQKLREARKQALPSDGDRAVTLRRQGLERHPDDLPMRGDLATLLHGRGEYAESMTHWRALLERLPENADARVGLGAALVGLGRTDEALTEFDVAVDLSHDPATLCDRAGVLLFTHGKIDDAIAQFREALRIEPSHADARSNLGTALYAKGKLDEAIVELAEAVRISDRDAEARVNLAVVLFSAGRVDEAISHMQDAVRVGPYYQLAHRRLAEMLASEGRLQEAAERLDAAQRLASDSPEVRAEFDAMRRRLRLRPFRSTPHTQPASAPRGE